MIDALSLVAYVLLYVTMVGLIRARVARFHPSMWLDGLIGALGTTAVGVAFLLGPYLQPTAATPAAADGPGVPDERPAAAGPARRRRLDPRRPPRPHAADRDRRARASSSPGTSSLFVRSTAGTYVDGGPLDLGWLVGICLVAARR